MKYRIVKIRKKQTTLYFLQYKKGFFHRWHFYIEPGRPNTTGYRTRAAAEDKVPWSERHKIKYYTI